MAPSRGTRCTPSSTPLHTHTQNRKGKAAFPPGPRPRGKSHCLKYPTRGETSLYLLLHTVQVQTSAQNTIPKFLPKCLWIEGQEHTWQQGEAVTPNPDGSGTRHPSAPPPPSQPHLPLLCLGLLPTQWLVPVTGSLLRPLTRETSLPSSPAESLRKQNCFSWKTVGRESTLQQAEVGV